MTAGNFAAWKGQWWWWCFGEVDLWELAKYSWKSFFV
jgi:hypothetical protein